MRSCTSNFVHQPAQTQVLKEADALFIKRVCTPNGLQVHAVGSKRARHPDPPLSSIPHSSHAHVSVRAIEQHVPAPHVRAATWRHCQRPPPCLSAHQAEGCAGCRQHHHQQQRRGPASALCMQPTLGLFHSGMLPDGASCPQTGLHTSGPSPQCKRRAGMPPADIT